MKDKCSYDWSQNAGPIGTVGLAVRLSRLYQPRNPQFWLLVALNALSAAISWLLQTRSLSLAPTLVLAIFALANFLLGLRIAVQLMKEPAEGAGSRE